jgi:hypothetical protein
MFVYSKIVYVALKCQSSPPNSGVGGVSNTSLPCVGDRNVIRNLLKALR